MMLKAIRAARCIRPRPASHCTIIKLCSSSQPSAVKYERKTPHEHVLLRPGMYVGQVEASSNDVWTFNEDRGRMQKSARLFSPALIKLFDEILVNAADNKQRDRRMSTIDISVEEKGGKLKISIRNDGKGIPVVKHATEDMYIPELIFGHLLTGSNFDDSSGNLTGGRHGYGAKLTNIFSTKFQLETYDSQKGLLYSQQWENNMTKTQPPVIETRAAGKKAGDYTLVTFEPDMARFLKPNDDGSNERQIADTIVMMKRRALDVAASAAPVKVTFNGKVLPVHSFLDYVSLFTTGEGASIVDASAAEAAGGDVDGLSEAAIEGAGDKIFHAKVNDRWEVAVMRSPTPTAEQMSFVNSVWTPRGGSHERLVTGQVTAAVHQALLKKYPQVSEAVIRNKLMVFVKCSVENPAFDSQSKDALTSRPSTFGSSCALTQAFLKRFVRSSGVLEDILLDISYREQAKLLSISTTKGGKGQRVDIPKLEDAHLAGGRRALECTLILTEGDSAKALAVAGLEIVGRQTFGVFPLRGKMLNVRVAPPTQLAKNEELVNLIKTLGLDFNKTYESGLEGLRYGRVMMMCDQDKDGSHIKGLIMNFFHTFWPHLLKRDGFLQQFITPLVKVRGAGAATPSSFYSTQEYDIWRRARGSTSSPEHVKYYKGLGTNTAVEGREYFRALGRHRKTFKAADDASTDNAIDLVFSKSRADDRRRWLSTTFDAASFVDPGQESVTFEEFIDKELIQFSHADNHRSIPSAVDGLKPAQRKILHGCFKRRLESDVKVVQLAGYIAEQTAYHHGDASLHATLINMAQDFVGSNNVPLLVPSGQFGTRAQGGKDFASPRYIFTRLSQVARALYPSADDAILDYLTEDGQAVEPKYFIPVIPTLLLNGCEGIGTGWSSFVPSFNPLDIIDVIESRLRGGESAQSASSLAPWYRGFHGSMSRVEGGFVARGVATVVDKSTVVITELPIGKWTNDYKEFLCKMVAQGEIKSFVEDHTTDRVKFVVQAPKTDLASVDLHSMFRLEAGISLANMHAFNKSGTISRYQSPEALLEEHFHVRLDAYKRRKESLSIRLAVDEEVSRNKARFVDSILDGSLAIVSKGRAPKTEKELEKELVEMGFAKMNKIRNRLITDVVDIESSDGDQGYGYLLSMPISSLSKQRAASLVAAAAASLDKLNALAASSPEDLWLTDLQVLRKCLSGSIKADSEAK